MLIAVADSFQFLKVCDVQCCSVRYYHVGIVERSLPKMVSRNRLSDRCNIIFERHLWHLFNHCESSLLEIFQAVTVVSMIAYSSMFNVCSGKPLLWPQTNPETTGLEGIVNPFIHYHRKICVLG